MEFNPFDLGWSYRKNITIDHSQVAGDLSDFPVLVSMVDSDLAIKAQSDGDDVLFLDGDGVAYRLFHEIELFDGSDGELVAWVNVPVVSDSEDTILYMYYGNSDCGNQEYPTYVWDSNYCSIWHLDDFDDSTMNGNDGLNHGTDDCNGKIGNAKDFNRVDYDYIDLGDMQEPADKKTTTATFEMWVNPNNFDISNALINKANTGQYEPDKLSYGFSINDERKIHCAIFSGTWYPSGNKIYFATNDPLLESDSWQHISIAINLLEQKANIYFNGEEKDNTRTIVGTPPSCFYNIDYPEEIGKLVWETATRRYDGAMDEVRISKICRSSEWVITEFNNQNDPSSFLNIGPEET
jgi:MSHA biogenesis protein MshQ